MDRNDVEDNLVRRLRQFQADEPGFPPLFSRAADEIERLRREILRCDDACLARDKEIAQLKTGHIQPSLSFQERMQRADEALGRALRRVTVLERVIYEELRDSGCLDAANEMIADEINARLSVTNGV